MVIALGCLIAPDVRAQGGTGGAPIDFGFDSSGATCGDWQPPVIAYGRDALRESLGIDAAPATAMRQLQAAEREAVKNAIAANNFAATVAAAFVNQASTSIQTSSNLAVATEAAGVQEALIDFASALADLASVSDFFEDIATGEFSDNTLLQKLDAIYEAAKDGESAANNIADQIVPPPEGGTSPINDAFGTMGVADTYWGTNGLTSINALKSDFSDITSLIDDHRSGKPVDPRTLGQLIIRVAKGFAEDDLKERKQHIANLQRDLAAEQCTTGSLSRQLQQANEAKWQADDRLADIRKAEMQLIAADPTALASGRAITGAASPVQTVTAKCPACQDIADQINRAASAMHAAGQRIDEIEAARDTLQAKKTRLAQLKNALAGFDSVTGTARDALDSTNVPVLGPAPKIQGIINQREMDRRQQVNEITRLEHEIAIEEGDPAAQVATLQAARSALLQQLRELRAELAGCEEKNCTSVAQASDFERFFTGVFLGADAAWVQDLGHSNAGLSLEQDVLTGGGSVELGGQLNGGFVQSKVWFRHGSAEDSASYGAQARIFIQPNGGIQAVGVGAGAGEQSLTSEITDVGASLLYWPTGLAVGSVHPYGLLQFYYREHDENHRFDYPAINFFIDQMNETKSYSLAVGPGLSMTVLEFLGGKGAVEIGGQALAEFRHDRGEGSYHTAQTGVFDTTVTGENSRTTATYSLKLVSGIRIFTEEGVKVYIDGHVSRDPYTSLMEQSGAVATLESDHKWSYGGGISVGFRF